MFVLTRFSPERLCPGTEYNAHESALPQQSSFIPVRCPEGLVRSGTPIQKSYTRNQSAYD